MLDHPGPVLFDCVVEKHENCFPMIPSGKAHNEMLLGEDVDLRRDRRRRRGPGLTPRPSATVELASIAGAEAAGWVGARTVAVDVRAVSMAASSVARGFPVTLQTVSAKDLP